MLKQYFPQALDWVGKLDSRQACDFLEKWPTLAPSNAPAPPPSGASTSSTTADGPRHPGATGPDRHRAAADHRPRHRRHVGPRRPGLRRPAPARPGRGPGPSIRRSRPSSRPTPITSSSRVCRGRVRWVPRDSPRPSAPTAPAGRPRRTCRPTPASPRSPTRSGKTCWVHHRLACPKFLKQTFHEYADQSIRFSTWARRYYDQQRDAGNSHHAAIRALAFKWIRILFRCWKDRTPYDEATYLAALRRKGSPLVKIWLD